MAEKDRRDLRLRLMEKRQIVGDCWRFTGTHNRKGYGHIKVEGTHTGVHRVSHMLFIGPIPEGFDVDHLCGVRDCFNPTHLEAVSHSENLRRSRGASAINAAKTHCIRGHEFTPENTRMNARRRACLACVRERRRIKREQLQLERKAS